MPRLYREAPLNSIWEGSGNVACLDVLRAMVKSPESVEIFFDEIEQTAGSDDARGATRSTGLKRELSDFESAETRARHIVERMALTLQGALLVRHGDPAVADAFCASRLAGDWGHAFGTLPAGVDHRAIIDRHRPRRELSSPAGRTFAILRTRGVLRSGETSKVRAEAIRPHWPILIRQALPSKEMLGGQIDTSRADLRHPHRRGPELVPRPVPVHLVADRLLPVGAAGRDDSSAFVLATVSTLLFFLSILLHELGHAVVAMRNGIAIAGIDLWLFGGVAKMSRDTQSPGVEFRVAAAGPLVTLVIAIVCAGLGDARGRRPGRVRELRRIRRGGHDRRPRRDARVPDEHQHRAARVQPDPGVPARRRPHRPGDHLEGHGRPHAGHPERGAARAGLLLHPDRRSASPGCSASTSRSSASSTSSRRCG